MDQPTGAEISADYLVVGAGAMGLAFADVIVKETEATVAIVDRLDKPGGHWNHAYPFVRLHQPSAFYGVNSRPLGRDQVDLVGRNRGLLELASVGEVLDYFDCVMRRDLLASGRVQYFPQSEYLGEGRFRARATGRERRVAAGKTVDATYMKVMVPQIEPPRFAVADGVACVPPNALGALERSYDAFVMIGAGKTAIDACLYLLDLEVPPEKIIWITPRDSWLFNRAEVQPDNVLGGFLKQAEAIAASTSIDDLFARIEATGALLRLHRQATPTMFRCATVSMAEVEDLRRIENVVRRGRVTRLEPGRAHLEGGVLDVPDNALFVNCSADGLEKRPIQPMFHGDRITLQTVRACQQVFSAAFIAHVETMDRTEAEKNALCRPAPHPDDALDYLRLVRSWMGVELEWASDPEVFGWLSASRLDAFSNPLAEVMLGRAPVSAEQAVGVVQAAIAKIDDYLGGAQDAA